MFLCSVLLNHTVPTINKLSDMTFNSRVREKKMRQSMWERRHKNKTNNNDDKRQERKRMSVIRREKGARVINGDMYKRRLLKCVALVTSIPNLKSCVVQASSVVFSTSAHIHFKLHASHLYLTFISLIPQLSDWGESNHSFVTLSYLL